MGIHQAGQLPTEVCSGIQLQCEVEGVRSWRSRLAKDFGKHEGTMLEKFGFEWGGPLLSNCHGWSWGLLPGRYEREATTTTMECGQLAKILPIIGLIYVYQAQNDVI